MEPEEVEDGDKDDNVENDSNRDEDQLEGEARSVGLQCLHDGLDAEDNEQDVECGHDSCVKKQKNKCLAVVEADAAVDPGTRR